VRSIYLDESEGTILGGHVLAVAGYVGSDAAWTAFTDEWKTKVLDAFSIPHFHTTDLRNPEKRLFRHLGLAARRRLLAVAADVIVSHVEAGCSVYIRPNDWKELTTEAERCRWGGAYEACIHTLLPLFSSQLAVVDRVNVYLEEGHKNMAGALQAIADYQQATEPVQWPGVMGDGHQYDGDSLEMKMRISSMRIEKFGSVKKAECAGAQAADLFAYLVTTVMRNDTGVFAGLLDSLVQRTPHAVYGLGPRKLSEFVESLKAYERVQKNDRQALYAMRKELHQLGVKTYALPWGIVSDKGDPSDPAGQELRIQIEAIRDAFEDIKKV
jgi:hypothetical protein